MVVVQVESANWSGEGTFTAALLEVLKTLTSIEFLRVEDAPASRTDAVYMFISNEVYVRFAEKTQKVSGRWLGVVPVPRMVKTPSSTLVDLEAQLATTESIGAPDYADETMLQYLKTERIVPPYQTRGYKLVEMVRIYALSS
jgi:hypothetical protein